MKMDVWIGSCTEIILNRCPTSSPSGLLRERKEKKKDVGLNKKMERRAIIIKTLKRFRCLLKSLGTNAKV